jgi:hypothetical protein
MTSLLGMSQLEFPMLNVLAYAQYNPNETNIKQNNTFYSGDTNKHGRKLGSFFNVGICEILNKFHK